jgi:hypothetical protein
MGIGREIGTKRERDGRWRERKTCKVIKRKSKVSLSREPLLKGKGQYR